MTRFPKVILWRELAFIQPSQLKFGITETGRERLSLFARLYENGESAAARSRLPVVHSEEIVRVLEKFAQQEKRLGDLENVQIIPEMWNEARAQSAGVIRREVRYPNNAKDWIISGPHFYVATPLNKTPNENCSHNLDYSDIDLTAINSDYLPRTNYVPSCNPKLYEQRTPKWNGHLITDFYRHVHRRQLSPTGERTLVNAIIPPGVSHINSVVSAALVDLQTLLLFSGLCSSVVYDFFVKSTGRGDLLTEGLSILPVPALERKTRNATVYRVLRLNCLTAAYTNLWNATFLVDFGSEMWTCDGAILGKLQATDRQWKDECGLRIDYARRQALVELDALAALALNLTEEELVTIYRVQFPVLRQYERENLYDQSGRLVPRGVLDVANRYNIDIHQPLPLASFRGPAEVVGEVKTPGLGMTGGILWEDPKMEPRMTRVYPPPFTKCDREADMRQAYQVFQERIRNQENAE